MIPSEREIIFTSALQIILSATITVKTKAVTTDIYISRLTVSFLNLTGLINAIVAKITARLNKLVPKIFPSAISLLPACELVIAIINSGKLVPKATIVIPNKTSLILNTLPISEPASTKKSEPFIRRIIPNTSRYLRYFINAYFI